MRVEGNNFLVQGPGCFCRGSCLSRCVRPLRENREESNERPASVLALDQLLGGVGCFRSGTVEINAESAGEIKSPPVCRLLDEHRRSRAASVWSGSRLKVWPRPVSAGGVRKIWAGPGLLAQAPKP
jgi:hypothetical protein